ncbi:LysE family translocator [Aliivibrio finisterrensis]|uniref:LysE family translocator n=1 Tax=Aliivibrio finisterrensis TaxID=511998 RepID=A0A6N6RXA3_9GAMM|nr:LysE family translocator [Aliivibrio finisterrensis]KAB2826409.1 LysE family translocator [Aliivibrio finisterrensis]
MSLFLAMVMFAFVTSLSPGPVNILATITGANHGYTRTVPHIFGATVGFVLILIILGLGLIRAFNDSHTATLALNYLGSAFLLYLAYKVATSERAEHNKNKKDDAPTMLQGLLCQWLNPKAWIVSLSGLTVFSSNGVIPLEDLGVFSVIFFIVCYCCISTWALLGITIGKYLEHPIHYKIFNRAMGGLLALTVVYVFFISK